MHVFANFKELCKARDPDQVASNYNDFVERTGIILLAMTQSHRICNDFIAHRWCDYSVMSSVIDFYFFRSMVVVSSFKNIKEEEMLVVQKSGKELKADTSKYAMS